MKVKKYTSASMKEALSQIRKELGEDALIISTREITAPLGKKFIEVTAAAEERSAAPEEPNKRVKKVEPIAEPEPPVKKKEAPETSLTPGLEEQILKNRVLLAESLKPLKEEIFQLRTMMDELRRSARSQKETVNVDLSPIQDEVKGLKRMFNILSKQANFDNVVSFSPLLKELYHALVSTEVEETIAFNLVEVLEKQMPDEDKSDIEKVRTALAAIIEKTVAPANPVILNQNKPTVMAFIGPTGVGKTTTIAKLAARCTLQMKKKVTLITIDTYRIAAVEQLKTYAKIMDLPIFVCYSADDMKKTIKQSGESALVLIDTAGHSQTDDEQISDLKNYFRKDDDIEVLLVLSATTKSNDLRDISDRFSIVQPDKLVFTKLDETTTYGPLLNESIHTKLPIGYFTTGQNVPDDIETATPSKLAKLILTNPGEAEA